MRRLLTWTDHNAGELLAIAGLAAVFVGLCCSPWPWTAPVVVGGTIFHGWVMNQSGGE